MGLIVSIVITFLLLSLLTLFTSTEDMGLKQSEKSKITSALGNFSKKNKLLYWVLLLF